jgi:hypothetical protein
MLCKHTKMQSISRIILVKKVVILIYFSYHVLMNRIAMIILIIEKRFNLILGTTYKISDIIFINLQP